MRQLTWHCGASVLVDDAYQTWDVKAPTISEAWDKAYEELQKSNVLDTGSLDIYLDVRQMTMMIGNLASDDNNPYEPSPIDLDRFDNLRKNDPILYGDLEWIISNANKEGRLD